MSTPQPLKDYPVKIASNLAKQDFIEKYLGPIKAEDPSIDAEIGEHLVNIDNRYLVFFNYIVWNQVACYELDTKSNDFKLLYTNTEPY